MRTISEYLSLRPNSLVHHYTSADAAISILENRQLRASKIRHLNDADEYMHAKSRLLSELEKRNKSPKMKKITAALAGQGLSLTGNALGSSVVRSSEHNVPIYVLSFSGEENLLSQWRAYCPNGEGYSLGFDLSNIPSDPFNGVEMVRCVYTEAEQDDLCSALIASWDECDPTSQWDVATLYLNSMSVMAAIKHPSFSEELEWRLILLSPQKVRFRSGRHGIVPYTEVSIAPDGWPILKKIWIGPNSDKGAASDALKIITELNGFQDVKLQVSPTPFRR
jgi:hypothetical protein